MQPIEERKWSDGTLLRRYFYEGDGKPALVCEDTNSDGVMDASEFYVLATDDRGSVVGVVQQVNGTATLVEKLHYNGTGLCKTFHSDNTPWLDGTGAALARPKHVRLGFTGMYCEPFTGKYHTHYREYDPMHNWWLSPDPIGEEGGINLVAFCEGDGLNYTDPDGRIIETGWDLASLGIGLGSLGYNVWRGNWGSAGLDLLGVVADGAATLLPGVPGGAGIAIKAGRAAKLVAGSAKVQKGIRALRSADQAVNFYQGADALGRSAASFSEGDAFGGALEGVGGLLQTAHFGSRVMGDRARIARAIEYSDYNVFRKLSRNYEFRKLALADRRVKRRLAQATQLWGGRSLGATTVRQADNIEDISDSAGGLIRGVTFSSQNGIALEVVLRRTAHAVTYLDEAGHVAGYVGPNCHTKIYDKIFNDPVMRKQVVKFIKSMHRDKREQRKVLRDLVEKKRTWL